MMFVEKVGLLELVGHIFTRNDASHTNEIMRIGVGKFYTDLLRVSSRQLQKIGFL